MNKGDLVPDFTLYSTEGDVINLYSQLEQHPVVLFFFLKAFTPLCTSEACSFQSQLPAFESAGAAVLGVSSDSESVARHFKKVFRLGYPLLLDQGGSVRKAFAVPRMLGFIPGRSTYVIGRDRTITGITHAHTRGKVHVEESLQFLQH